MTYWLGIDAGGTQSSLVCVDDSLRVIYREKGKNIQAKKLDKRELAGRVFALINPVLEKYSSDSIGGIGIGLAGAGRERDQINITQALSAFDNRFRYCVDSDAAIGHIGAFNNNDGVLIITGTGSLILGRRKNQWYRAGGYGYLLGDEGSGYMLGQLGLRAVGNMFDGGMPTVLFEYLRDEFEPSISNRDQLIDKVYSGEVAPASVAPLVIRAAREADGICLEIVRRQIYALADEAQMVVAHLDYEHPSIVTMGGLLNDEWFRQLLIMSLKDVIEDPSFCEPVMEPAIGACLMAKKQIETGE